MTTHGSDTTTSSVNGLYVERNPGDLITAEDWNHMQELIQQDIAAKSAAAAEAITHVDSATDADQLDGKDIDDLTDEITKRVLDSVRQESGYRKVFKVLHEGDAGDPEFNLIEHNLGNHPLVDLYELLYFEVACADDDDIYRSMATFYLHHTSEERIRVTENGIRVVVEIQPDFPVPIYIPLADMLTQYNVEYTDSTSLGDLETELWKAFFSSPNDRFNDDQYCHSPWFERCCREERDVASLKSKGDWDDLVFQMRPVKVVGGPVSESDNGISFPTHPTPANIGVAQVDLNRIALWLTGRALQTTLDGDRERGLEIPEDFRDELKLMVLLRA